MLSSDQNDLINLKGFILFKGVLYYIALIKYFTVIAKKRNVGLCILWRSR